MNLLEVGKMVTEDDIHELEMKMNLQFPKEYKKFLLKNNGGMPEDEVEFSFIEINPITKEKYEQGSDIHYFYNINEMINAYQNLTCEQLIHKDYVPIACDSFGNEILICLNPNKDNGNVFFANHEMVNINDTFWILSKISESFNKFMDMLSPMVL